MPMERTRDPPDWKRIAESYGEQEERKKYERLEKRRQNHD